MASQPLVALGVDNTQPNTLAAFQQGAESAASVDHNKIANAQQTIEMIGSGAMYAMPNGIDGEVDPAKYHEVLDTFQAEGIDVSRFRDNPNFAKVAAQASIDALHRIEFAQNDRDFAHTMEKYKSDLEQQGIENAREDKSLAIQQQNADSLTGSRGYAAEAGGDDAAAIGDAIMRGEQSPETTGLYKLGPKVRAYLARQGYNQATAQLDFGATKKRYASLNSTQQVRLEEAVSMVDQSLPLVEQLAEEWDAGGFPILNAAALESAKQGALGPDAQSLATRLEAQIADITSELGTVYKGGNSSTDESLKLAATQLNANWSEQTLKDAIAQIKKNIQYRKNSIAAIRTAGVSNSQYDANPAPNGEAAPAGDDGYTIEEVSP